MANSALSITNTPLEPRFHTLAASVGSNALTIALKNRLGQDPSAADPLDFYFPDGSGGQTKVSVSAATSLVVSSGSTLGTASGAPSRIWVVGFNDAGTFRLGVVNCHSSNYTADSFANIAAIQQDAALSSTAEGGAGAADSGQTYYTGTAVSSKYLVILGYVESTQATAGTWATAPSKVVAWRQGMPVPGQIIRTLQNTTAGGSLRSGHVCNRHDQLRSGYYGAVAGEHPARSDQRLPIVHPRGVDERR